MDHLDIPIRSEQWPSVPFLPIPPSNPEEPMRIHLPRSRSLGHSR